MRKQVKKTPAPLRRWNVVPKAHADEDPASLIFRLATKHFVSPGDFFRLYLGRPFHLYSDVGTQADILEQIETIAGYDNELLRSMSWSRSPTKRVAFRGRLLPGDWISERRRVAPGVLAADGEDPYIRLSWRFPAIPFDFDSGHMLIDSCPACHRPLTWTGVRSVFRCQACNYDLRMSPAVLARQEIVEPTRKLAAHIGLLPGKRLTFPFPFDNADEIVEMRLIEWCAWFSGLMRLDRTSASVQTASMGINVAENWPASLELAVELALRHMRPLHIEQGVLQRALKSLPSVQMRRGAMGQLAEILKRSEFQGREGFDSSLASGLMYFQQ